VVFYRSLARHAPTADGRYCRKAVRTDIRSAAECLARGITD